MIKINMGKGMIRYEKSEPEKCGEALLRLAKILVQDLSDEQAVTVAELFDRPEMGRLYQPGERLRGKDGKLYKVKTAHKAGKEKPEDGEVYINLTDGVNKGKPQP